MINSVRLINFQGHKDNTLVFHKGLNVIVGSSDNGKSSVIRAIKWVVTNRPLGDDFIRHGTKECRVVLVTDDERTIERVRGTNGTNKYILDGKELRAFGKGVPDGVLDALKISALNMQHQHDSVFLLGDSPGEVAKQLNELCDMGVIDVVTKNTRGLINNNMGQLRNSEQAVEVNEEKLELLEWLPEAEELLKEGEEAEAGQEQAVGKKERCAGYVDKIGVCTEIVSGLEWVSETRKLLDVAKGFVAKRQAVQNQRLGCAVLANKLILHTTTINELKTAVDLPLARQTLSNMETLYTTNIQLRKRTIYGLGLVERLWKYENILSAYQPLMPAKKQIGTVFNQCFDMESTSETQKKVSDAMRSVLMKTRAVEDSKNELEELRDSFGELDLPDVCPTCGQQVEDWKEVGHAQE